MNWKIEKSLRIFYFMLTNIYTKMALNELVLILVCKIKIKCCLKLVQYILMQITRTKNNRKTKIISK